jgi:RNA polymerase sigma factor (sigma-70 family)
VADSDWELVRACRAGDDQAWRRLLDKYERLVYSIPLSYRLSRDDAADISQLTFTILIGSLESLGDDVALAAWLATVARRHTWRLLADRKRQITSDSPVEELVALPHRGSADPIARWELVTWLHEGLGQLDERCRELLVALYLEPTEPSYAEVASRRGMPIGSIGPTRARCLERLKKFMAEP